MIEPLITSDQRGFLAGRSMLANLVDVDEAMAYTASRGEGGIAFFVVFAAAFPSIEHEFFLQLWSEIGMAAMVVEYHSNT